MTAGDFTIVVRLADTDNVENARRILREALQAAGETPRTTTILTHAYLENTKPLPREPVRVLHSVKPEHAVDDRKRNAHRRHK